MLDVSLASLVRRQIRIKKAERVWGLDYPHPRGALLVHNLVTESLRSRPMDLRPEMMFGVVTIVEPSPIVELVVGAYAPRNRLVRIATVMRIVAVQVREAVAKIPERQKKTDVMPVENTEDHKSRDKRREFEDSPKRLARIFPFQFLKDRLGIFAEKAKEGVFQRMFGFTVVSMLIDRNPIDFLTMLVRPVGISLVMLHVNALVEDLAETDRD